MLSIFDDMPTPQGEAQQDASETFGFGVKSHYVQPRLPTTCLDWNNSKFSSF